MGGPAGKSSARETAQDKTVLVKQGAPEARTRTEALNKMLHRAFP